MYKFQRFIYQFYHFNLHKLLFMHIGNYFDKYYIYNSHNQYKMLSLRILSTLYKISSIKQSLRTLQLSIPTSKSSIKKQYLIMAKKYHPDSASTPTSSSSSTASKTSNPINKQLQQKFININQAYQYLKEYTQQQINNNRDKDINSNNNNNNNNNAYNNGTMRENRRRMTQQQQQRQQTYQYFNRRYYQEMSSSSYNYSSEYQQNNSKQSRQQQQYRVLNNNNNNNNKRMSLYKSVPQLFVGFLLLAVLLGDWTYKIINRDRIKDRKGDKQSQEQMNRNAKYKIIKEKQQEAMRDVFRNMNHNNRFRRKNIDEQIQ